MSRSISCVARQEVGASAHVRTAHATPRQRAMREREVLAIAVDQYSMRLVTHLDVTRAQVEQAAQVICAVLNH